MNRRQSLCFVLVLFVFPIVDADSQSSTVPQETVREWTNLQGKSIRGTLLGVEGDSIHLEVKGKEFVIPLTSLSAEDNAFIERWRNALSVAQLSPMRVLRSEGEFEIRGEDGTVIDPVGEGNGDSPTDPTTEEPGAEFTDLDIGKKFAEQRRRVFAGQSIQTGPGANVDLYSTDGVVLRMQGDTEVKVSGKGGGDGTESLRLLEGEVYLDVDSEDLKEDRKEFRLRTPAALLAVKGTQFFVKARQEETIAGVYEGRIEGIGEEGVSEFIDPGFVAKFLDAEVSSREMTDAEKRERRVFHELSVRKSSLAENTWGWNAFDWEVHTLMKRDGPEGRAEISSVNLRRAQNQAGNLAVEFRPITEEFGYGEYRIDTVVPEPGDGFVGAEFRIRAKETVNLIVTTIGADEEELGKKKQTLLERKAFEFLVQFHDLTTIAEHKRRFWRNFRMERESVILEGGEWVTHFVPFSKRDYPDDYEVKSWFVFLCLGPDVVAEKRVVELEVAPPVLIFEEEAAER